MSETGLSEFKLKAIKKYRNELRDNLSFITKMLSDIEN